MDDKTMFDVLKPFMPLWCQKVLPAVFDQSLSYYELLCKVLQKYNELVAVVNAHSEKLENHETRIVTLETITKEIQQKLAELDEAVKQNTANIAALTERVNQHDKDIETIQAFINALTNSTTEHLFEINTTANTIAFTVNSVLIPYQSAIDTLVKRGSQVMKGGFVGGSVSIGAFDTSSTTGRIFGYVIGIENNDLHYSTFVSNTNEGDPNTGKISSWRSVELLDLTNIKQSLGNGEYDTISQKVLTQLINSKLNHDMGITGATAGQYLNIATVDSDGKPLTYGFGTPGGGGSGVDIVQTTGQSTTDVMSQKATTDALDSTVEYIENNFTAEINLVRVTISYPSTTGGTDGKFIDANGTALERVNVLNLCGSVGKNAIFTVKKTGSSDWQRITWFKSSAGEGLYDFAWYETDGVNAKCGVDRLTMATTGLFAVSEESSKDLGGGSGIHLSTLKGTATLNPDAIPGTSSSGTASRTITISIPISGVSTLEEATAALAACTNVSVDLTTKMNLKSASATVNTTVTDNLLNVSKIYDETNALLYVTVLGSVSWCDPFRTLPTSNWPIHVFGIWAMPSSFANGVLTLTGYMKTVGGSDVIFT
jgi:hypothetical protein